jgi:hypothetical protein
MDHGELEDVMSRRVGVGRGLPGLAVLVLGVLAAACDSVTEPPLHVPAVTLEAVGDVAQLLASGADGALPSWESLDPTVVTVTQAGMAVAVASGSARVRARLGSRTAEGTVTVLPPVAVTISDFRVVTNGNGEYAGMAMQLKNEGGRGYYRLQFWKERAEGETEHRLILNFITDSEAPVGMDIQSAVNLTAEPADWVMAYSREPSSLGYTRTACVRMDGGTPCPMP